MWLWADAAVPELATSATAPAAVARARRVAFIGRDSRKPSWMAATADARTGSAKKSRRGDSNPRPTTYEAVALPLSYSGTRAPSLLNACRRSAIQSVERDADAVLEPRNKDSSGTHPRYRRRTRDPAYPPRQPRDVRA